MFRSNICALIARRSARPSLRTASRSMFSASQTHRDNNTAINSKKNFSSTTMHNTFSNKTTLLFNGTMSHLPLHRKLHYFAATNVATTTAAPIDTTNAIVNTATPLGTDAALQAADQIATTATQLTPYTWEYFQACTFFHVRIYAHGDNSSSLRC